MNKEEMIKLFQKAIDDGLVVNSQYKYKSLNLPNPNQLYKTLRVYSWKEAVKELNRENKIIIKEKKEINLTIDEIGEKMNELSVKLKKEFEGPSIKELQNEIGFSVETIKGKFKKELGYYLKWSDIKSFYGFWKNDWILEKTKKTWFDFLVSEFINGKKYTKESIQKIKIEKDRYDIFYISEIGIKKLFNVSSLEELYTKRIEPFVFKKEKEDAEKRSFNLLPYYLESVLLNNDKNKKSYSFISNTIINYCKENNIKKLIILEKATPIMISQLIKDFNKEGLELYYSFLNKRNNEYTSDDLFKLN